MNTMIQILSNVAFTFFALAYLPVFLMKIKQAEDPKQLWRERWGTVVLPPPAEKKRIWLHAVSVGEVRAVETLIRLLEARGFEVVLSTVTPTGQREARKISGTVLYFPFDLSGPVLKSLRAVQPDLILLAETEIWPNFIEEAARLQIPVGIINGRLSKRSFERYQWINSLMALVLKKVSFFFVQTPADKERIQTLGADPARIEVLGNLKFDSAKGANLPSSEVLKNSFHIPSNRRVWVAGSTHPGEEEKVLSVFTRLRSVFHDLTLVVAPRHIERTPQVEMIVKNFNFKPALFTQLSEAKGSFDVLILDTIGELKKTYSFADAVWMGGSFVPHGGQNPIEPALFEKPVLSGPQVFNFEFVYQALEKDRAVTIVHTEDELFAHLKDLLNDPVKAKEFGVRAKRTVDKLSGASLRTAEKITLEVGSR